MRRLLRRSELIGYLGLAVVLLVVFPLALDSFRLSLVSKYLCFAFVAVGVVLAWGYGGVLSLGQGLFFEANPSDPRLYAATAGTVALAGLVATLVPAARAARVDPARALRGQ